MTAVDTNVVIRLLVKDDPKQTGAARAIFESGSVWIAKTVLIESAWVLRSVYGLTTVEVRDALKTVTGLDGVILEDRASVTLALDLVDEGVAFPDALHLFSRPPGATFVSFDRQLVTRVTRAHVPAVWEIV